MVEPGAAAASEAAGAMGVHDRSRLRAGIALPAPYATNIEGGGMPSVTRVILPRACSPTKLAVSLIIPNVFYVRSLGVGAVLIGTRRRASDKFGVGLLWTLPSVATKSGVDSGASKRVSS